MPKTPRKLREIRKAKGFTLESLAAESGVSMSAIGNFETGSRGLGAEKKRLIADILHCSVEEISEHVQPEGSGSEQSQLARDDWHLPGGPDRDLKKNYVQDSLLCDGELLVQALRNGQPLSALAMWTNMEKALRSAAALQEEVEADEIGMLRSKPRITSRTVLARDLDKPNPEEERQS